ncbi:MAG TPA: hypothetical protein VEA59_02055, partial [Patescibacteria group bacterium]|nr:hypothetical protein [Patescibacteria group bacterium]
MAKTEKEIGNFYTEQSDPKKVKAQLAERINEKYGLENDATQDELSEAVEELLDFEKERVRVNEYEREEVEILASWVDRLRGPNVSRFFVLVKSNPDLHSLLSPGLNRKQRFARFKAEEGFVPTQEQALPALDSLKPLLSSILTNKRLSLLFFSSLRRDVKRESRIMKAEMKKKGASFETPFLAVGSGPQSAVVSSEALTKAFPLPKEFPQVGEEGSYRNSLKEFSKILLTIERQERCGGQFGQYGGDVFQ